MNFKHRTEHGQALVLIAIGLLALIAITALAIDAGNAFSDRRQAQNAADTAVLAAALEKIQDTPSSDPDGLTWSSAGLARASSNGYTNTNNDVCSTVCVNNPPVAGCNETNGPYVGNLEYFQVIIRSNVDTYFAPIVGIDQVHNCVEAIARAQPPVPAPIAFGNAMVSLNPQICKAFWVHGTSDAEVTGGGVFVNSACDSGAFQAFDQSGNGKINAPSICVVGGATYNASDVSPAPVKCTETIPYPPEWLWPQPSCGSTNGTNIDDILTPGNIPGDWFIGDKTLESGIYCISGDVSFNANDHITGTGVLLYFINGGLNINGGAEVYLSAQTTGDYVGLLIYLPITNPRTVTLNGNGNSEFTGTILAPASEILVNGTGSAYGYRSQIIGYKIDLVGSSATSIDYNDNENYDITMPPSIEIVQ